MNIDKTIEINDNIRNTTKKRTRRMLGITTLHNSMILSTLRISSHGFTLGFPERPPLNRGSTPSLESSNKVHPFFDT